MISEAWLIHKQPQGESSLRLIFFTREQGIFWCQYKGGRAFKKQIALQPFIPLWLHYREAYAYHYITSVEPITSAINLNRKALFSALYINELLYYSIKPEDPYPDLYAKYVQTINALTQDPQTTALERLLREFEWLLLKECGYQLHATPEMQAVIPPLSLTPIIQGHFIDEVLQPAKWVMRQAIDDLLEGKPLKSRQLFLASKNYLTKMDTA